MNRLTHYILFSACVLASYTASAQQLTRIPIDGYAASVDDRIITVGEVMSVIRPLERQLRGRYSGDELEEKLREAFDAALESLIDNALILEEFEKLQGQLPERIVDEQIADIISERFDNNRGELMAALTEEHITYDEWRTRIRNQLIVSILKRQEITSKVSVTPRTVRETYEERIDEYRLPEQVQVRMIVLNRGETPEERKIKQEEAEGIIAKLKSGADFAETAKAVSEGANADKGGDWGWIEPSYLRSELAEAIKEIEAGELSDALVVEDAIYIIRVEARKRAGVISFEEAKPQITEELERIETERLYGNWLERLRDQHYIKYY